jgi:ribosomal protein S18 acetylase RimI-like enzyme
VSPLVPDLVIREARSDDAEELRRIAAEAVLPDVAAAGGTREAPRTEQLLDGDLVFVALMGRHLAGYAAVSERDGELLLDQLVIAPTDEGMGVGNRLLDWVEGYGCSRDLRIVRIAVEPGNERARDFYARRGYQPGGDRAVTRELVHR